MRTVWNRNILLWESMVQLYVNIAKHAIEKYGTTIVTSWDWGIWVTMGITVIMYTHVLYVCMCIYIHNDYQDITR